MSSKSSVAIQDFIIAGGDPDHCISDHCVFHNDFRTLIPCTTEFVDEITSTNTIVPIYRRKDRVSLL